MSIPTIENFHESDMNMACIYQTLSAEPNMIWLNWQSFGVLRRGIIYPQRGADPLAMLVFLSI